MDDQRKHDLEVLSIKLGHRFIDISLLDIALRHSSYVHEHSKQLDFSNERLEFLGDAVLNLVISHELYKYFPKANEGQLSKNRSKVVNEYFLAMVSRKLGLGDYLLLGRGEKSQCNKYKSSMLADTMEAVLAAIYLDGGLLGVQQCLKIIFGSVSDLITRQTDINLDYKSCLQERIQDILHLAPRYYVKNTEGADHQKIFIVIVEINGKVLAEGIGRSRKEAEQNAAQNGLIIWNISQKFLTYVKGKKYK